MNLFPISVEHKYGFINEIGKVVIEPQFNFAYEFNEGRACIEVNGKHGFVDETGRLVINAKYDLVHDFFDGLAKVNIGGTRNHKGHFIGGKWGLGSRGTGKQGDVLFASFLNGKSS